VLTPIVGRILPTLSVPTGIDGSTLSRDPSVAAKAAADPLCVSTGTTRFGAEGVREQRRVRSMAADGLGRPTLVLHGLDDRLVDPSASEPFEKAPMTERRTYPGLRHELHNEPEGPEIVEAIIAWLRDQVAARDRLTVQSHTPPGSATSAESVAPPQTRGT
jgi:alpha-beta hydrolase superfamily lysophospholipase